METQKLSEYNFDLPKELIAQNPSEKRDESRLLVLNRKTGKIEHRQFRDIIEYLQPGDCLVLNKTKVFPARLFGKKETGGKVEALFLRNIGGNQWLALVKPFLEEGKKIIFPEGLTADIKGKTPLGEVVLELNNPGLESILQDHGRMPLPPYIKREGSFGDKDTPDRQRYQTVFAQEEGSIAAPTAGLHFTEKLLESIKERGVDIAEIVLHVGWGTFRPIISEELYNHKMLPEAYEIPAEAISKIRKAKSGGRIVVVGTTSCRALETEAGYVLNGGRNILRGETEIFIYPGHKFAVPDVFLTNFHLPKSTPLMMTSAFAGREFVLKAYSEAIKMRYRFFSYGDAMLIL